jgi:hypothetical protein
MRSVPRGSPRNVVIRRSEVPAPPFAASTRNWLARGEWATSVGDATPSPAVSMVRTRRTGALLPSAHVGPGVKSADAAPTHNARRRPTRTGMGTLPVRLDISVPLACPRAACRDGGAAPPSRLADLDGTSALFGERALWEERREPETRLKPRCSRCSLRAYEYSLVRRESSETSSRALDTGPSRHDTPTSQASCRSDPTSRSLVHQGLVIPWGTSRGPSLPRSLRGIWPLAAIGGVE